MDDRTLLVIGAAGDVGQGITRAAGRAGWRVVAAGRDRARLDACAEQGGHPLICTGDLATAAGAAALWDAAIAAAGRIDAVVVAVNMPNRQVPLLQWTDTDIAALFQANLLTHFNAAHVMLPRLPADGLFIGIGGGTADFIIPGMAPLSMAQAALRMMYRGLAREQGDGVGIRELMIVSMVNGASKRAAARPEWVTDDDVGQHLCAILAAPDLFPGPILQLRDREQVGQPEPAKAKGR